MSTQASKLLNVEPKHILDFELNFNCSQDFADLKERTLNPIPDGGGRNHLFAPYRLNYSQYCFANISATNAPIFMKFET